MKRILGAITSVILAAAMLVMPVFAVSDENKETDRRNTSTVSSEGASGSSFYIPTVCFDNDKGLGYINKFGSADDSGLTLEIDKTRAQKNGSLAVSQNFAGVLPTGAENCGFYFTADSFGLEDFSGCELTMYIYALDAGADSLKFYTDGDIFLSADIPLTNSPVWRKIDITVSDDIANNMFGFLITSSKGYNDKLFYLDEITVTDPSGKKISNIGDYKQYYNAGDEKAAGALSVVLFVLLIIAVAVALAMFVLRMLRRYR